MAQLSVQLKDQLYVCEIKNSKRAKYLRLKLSNIGVLSVVVPSGVPLKKVQEFVSSQVSWIDRNLKTLDPVVAGFSKPSQLNLSYLDEIWGIEYVSEPLTNSLRVKISNDFTIECRGDVDNEALLKKQLGQWLKSKAEKVIPKRLATLAEYHGFHFNRVIIRGQKTRWGSCSTKKNINLNYKLLFLEPALVDYVLIHELCHTVEMNHSANFWALVGDCDTNYKQNDKELNKASRTIPL